MNGDRFGDDLRRLEAEGLLRHVRDAAAGGPGRRVVEGREVLDFASNDYLGLSRHSRVVAAAVDAAHRDGVGATASALVVRGSAQRDVEETLAAFEGEEAALVFPTGYAANVGTIAAVARSGDAVFCERENHACVVDGCRLSGAKLRVFRRDRLDRLERDLQAHPERSGRLVCVDGVYSMDGTLAPLQELFDLCGRFDATLLVDEAHASGILGRRGRGSCEHAGLLTDGELSTDAGLLTGGGLLTDGLIRTGTLSKAIGCQGGFVTGPAAMIEALRNTARTQMFSTALAPPVAAAAATAVRLIAEGVVRWDESRARPLREAAAAAARQPPRWAEAIGPIVAVAVADAAAAVEAQRRLLDHGVLAAAIRPPTVPRGTSRLRLSISMAHSEADVAQAAEALRAVLRKVPYQA